ncbi:hypothetical protein SLA2020_331170 [Shorea laevis]
MLRRHLIFKLISTFRPPRSACIHERRYLFSNPLCTIAESSPSVGAGSAAESPEVPTWFNKQKADSTDSDEDFVIPSLASWVESHKLDDHTKVVLFPTDEGDTDVDKVCKILKNRYTSYDKVVEELNGIDVRVSNSLIEQLLKRFDNDWMSASVVFTWAKSQTGYGHTPELFDTMVDILGKAKKFSKMWDLVREMQQLKGYVTLATMSKVMRRLARDGRYSDAIEAFQGLGQFGISQNAEAMNQLMDALVKGDSVEHAYQVFTEFKELIPPTLICFNILIHGFCRARKLEDAWKIMDEMEKHGYQPDVASYTCFLESYCREKDFRKVDDVLDEMQRKGCKPNVVAYTIIMKARGKADQITQALEVYEKMKCNGCLPDGPFYRSAIVMLSKAGRLKDAREIFEDMGVQGLKPDVQAYTAMISSLCEHSQEEDALQLLKKMEEDSCKPDLYTYAPLLKMCCRKKRMKVLNFLLSHMLKNDLSIDLGIYALLVKGLCNSGKLEHACSFFKEMVMKGMVPHDSTYKMLVKELGEKKMTEAKQSIENLMRQAEEQNIVLAA